ncbi:MAG: hypothetical protein ABI276_07000, partial [Acidimicrobiales bacterium]
MSDDRSVADGYPGGGRLRPGEKPDEVAVGEEDRIPVRFTNSAGDCHKLVEIVSTPFPDLHGQQSDESPSEAPDGCRQQVVARRMPDLDMGSDKQPG